MSGGDAAGAKRLIPEAWRRHKEFDNIHKLDGVAVITVQLRYNGWITEMQDSEKARTTSQVRPCMLVVIRLSLLTVCIVSSQIQCISHNKTQTCLLQWSFSASPKLDCAVAVLPTFSAPWSACVAPDICREQAAPACMRLVSDAVAYVCRAAQDWTICCIAQTQTSAALLT